MTPISWFLVAYAYLAATVFVVGSIAVIVKWLFTRKGPSNTYLGYPYLFTFLGNDTRGGAFINMLKRIFLFSSMKNDPYVRIFGLLFHWTLWIVIAAHADLILMPYLAASGISETTMEMIGSYLGTTLAFVMVIFGCILLYRRIGDIYMRKLSNASDYFSILLIVVVGISGIVMRFALPPLYAYTQVSPFIFSLLHFSPIAIPSAPAFMVHLFLVSTLLIYFPLSKFMHPYSFLTNPSMYSIFHVGEANEAKD